MTTFPRRYPKSCYRCGNVDRKPPITRHCDAPSFEKEMLENNVLRALRDTITNGDTLTGMVAARFAHISGDDNAAKIQELEQQLEFLRQTEERAFLNVQDPRLPRERTIDTWESAKRTRQDSEFELMRLRASRPAQAPSQEFIQSLARELATYEPKTFDEKRQFLQLFVSEIRISSTEIHISVNLPESLLSARGDRQGGNPRGEGKARANSGSCVDRDQSWPSPFVPPGLSQPISFTINAKLI
jgi:hypothetical protein